MSMRLFSTLAHEKVNVILISQASSEHSICIAIESETAQRAKVAIEKEFRHELREELIDEIKIEKDLSIVAVVGDGMKHHPGTSGRMFGAFGKNGVNVVAIAQGSSERNISAVIRQADVSKALNALHDAFFLSDKKTLNLFMVGTGLIGKTLVNQVNEQFQKLSEQNKLEVKLVGVANSKKMLLKENGLSLNICIENMKQSGEVMSMEKYFQHMTSFNLPSSVFVDCTNSAEIPEFYERILSENISIVTPNKKANSGSFENYQKLKSLAQRRGIRFLYETNVGAGLPVINTLNDLLLSGDKVIRIEAVLSGTLNYIFSSFTKGKNFSKIVEEAKIKGYTEPDPRDDLSGMDVARKILILAREAGSSLELSDISVENLVPENCREINIDSFLNKLEEHDSHFEKIRTGAEEQTQKLRYQAVFENNKACVKLGMVKSEHPFYSLSGSDNMILLTTERYHERPMVIRGPGAGAEVTAAGVFADIIRIGNYSN